MTKKADVIESLLKDQKVSNESIKAAISMYEEGKKKQDQERILHELKAIEESITYTVDRLRNIRQREKVAKEALEKVVEAKAAYLQTADYEAFLKVWNNLRFR